MALLRPLFHYCGKQNGLKLVVKNKGISNQIRIIHGCSIQRNCIKTPNDKVHDQTTKLQTFFLSRYVNYVRNYDKVLDSKFPAAMRVYRVFMVGTKEFYMDLKEFLRVVKRVNTSNEGIKSLTRQQIELYHKMPKDMIRVSPVLLLSAIPLSNYIIFPLAYFFPRILLTSHFWSIQQRSDFSIINLAKKLNYYKPTFRCVQEQLRNIEPMELHLKWAEILGLLGSGQQPVPEQILKCKVLFEKDQMYHLKRLSSSHVRSLLKMHGLHSGILFRRRRLADHASIVNEMDMAIIREGGADTMPMDALKNACFMRGLNPITMSHASMIQWLNEWTQVSSQITNDNLSLLLHLPIFLAYNQPTNWVLIYKKYKHIV